MKLRVSVVVCAHDEARWDQLTAALRSVDEQELRPAEVVLVIDHNPGLRARAGEGLPGVMVVENAGPAGLGGARNSGIDACTGDVVAFLDDDAVASRSWLASLADPYADPAVAGVGGAIQPLWPHGRPRWFPSEFDWVVGCSYRGMPECPQEVRNLFGANMSFRRDVLNELGRFRLGYGCDETELCIRLRKRRPAWKVVYVPKGNVFHHVARERAKLRYFLYRCYFEGGSKAVVAALVGAQLGLASERRYTRTTLPQGLRAGVQDFVSAGDLDGLARAATILAGLTATTAGYIAGSVSTTAAAERRGWCGTVPATSSRVRRLRDVRAPG